jgi:hypothetical protein
MIGGRPGTGPCPKAKTPCRSKQKRKGTLSKINAPTLYGDFTKLDKNQGDE